MMLGAFVTHRIVNPEQVCSQTTFAHFQYIDDILKQRMIDIKKIEEEKRKILEGKNDATVTYKKPTNE